MLQLLASCSLLALTGAGLVAQHSERALARLTDEKPTVRKAAVAALVRGGAKSVPALCGYLDRYELEAGGENAFATGIASSRGFTRRDPLQPYLTHYSVKSTATDWLWYRRNRDSWPGIVTSDADIAEIDSGPLLAMYALAEIGPRPAEVIPTLDRFLQETESQAECRQAAWALARLGAPALDRLLDGIHRPGVQRALAAIAPLARPRLISRLGSGEGSVRERRHYVYVLGIMGPDAPEQTVPALIALLGSPAPSIAAQAINALDNYGEHAREPLTRALSSRSSTVRLRALAALTENLPGAHATRLTISSLWDVDDAVQRYAAEALGRTRDTLVDEELLLGAIRNYESKWGRASFLVRLATLVGLAKLRDELAATPVLVHEALAAKEWQLRVAALRCLRASDASRVLPALETMLAGEPRQRLLFEALDVFDRMQLRGAPAKRAAKALAGVWSRVTRPQDRHEVLEAIGSLGPDAGEAAHDIVVKALDDPDERVVATAAKGIARFGAAPAPATARLRELLGDRRTRAQAARALMAVGAASGLEAALRPHLRRPRSDGDLAASVEALTATLPAGDSAPAVRDALMQAWRSKRRGYQATRAIVTGLGALPLAHDQIIAFLGHESGNVREAAIAAIAERRIRVAVTLATLERMAADDDSWTVRQAARAALPALRRELRSRRSSLSLADVFTDDMVLQRDLPVRVWGRTAPSDEVSVELAGEKARGRADESGRWSVVLPAMPATKTPSELTVRARETITLRNVLVGEVWLVSGQSNMSRPANGEQIRAAVFPQLRFFNSSGTTPRERSLDWPTGWTVCSPAGLRTAGDRWADRKSREVEVRAFSEVGYVFGRELHRALGVPVGLIQASAGGSTAKDWTPRASIARDFPFDDTVPRLKHTPGLLYHVRLRPLVPFTVRGAIWYQGEDDGRNLEYAGDLKRLIASWRRVFQRSDLPFYMVQIGATSYASGMLAVYEAQQRVMREVPGTGIAFSNDVYAKHLERLTARTFDNDRSRQRHEKHVAGLRKRLFRTDRDTGWPLHGMSNPHPPGKELVGRRLARIALREQYGIATGPVYGPTYASSRADGAKMIVEFEHTGGGLRTIDGKPLVWFELSDGSRKEPNGPYTYLPARARITGKNTVEVMAEGVTTPRFVRMGWHMYARFNLAGGSGLPAFPFRTDDYRDPRRR